MATLGKFELERVIGRGGMAEVFLGHHRTIGGFERKVCIKAIRPEFSEDPGFVKMLESEAKIAASLQHPSIVQVFDYDQNGAQHFIVMEFVDGLDLKSIVDDCTGRGMRLPVEFAVFVLESLLLALRYAHHHGDGGRSHPVIHRDISPHNLLLSVDGTVKLTDFGIAKLKDVSPKTQSGYLKGKLAYVAPEQLKGEPVSPRSDLYAAGLVFFEMLTGRRLITGRTNDELIDKILGGAPKKIPGYSSRIHRYLADLLAKDPRARVASASQALEGLGALDIPSLGPQRTGQLVEACRGRPRTTLQTLRLSDPDAETGVLGAPDHQNDI